jgi:hypothetical protein
MRNTQDAEEVIVTYYDLRNGNSIGSAPVRFKGGYPKEKMRVSIDGKDFYVFCIEDHRADFQSLPHVYVVGISDYLDP